jgi:hypothetical protein
MSEPMIETVENPIPYAQVGCPCGRSFSVVAGSPHACLCGATYEYSVDTGPSYAPAEQEGA